MALVGPPPLLPEYLPRYTAEQAPPSAGDQLVDEMKGETMNPLTIPIPMSEPDIGPAEGRQAPRAQSA